MQPRIFAAIALVYGLVSFSLAQDLANGVPAFSAQVGGVYDNVDPNTSRVMITIPVRQKNGPMPVSFSLVINSHVHYDPEIYGGNVQIADASVTLNASVPLTYVLTSYPTAGDNYCGTGLKPLLLQGPFAAYHAVCQPPQSGAYSYALDYSGIGAATSTIVNNNQYYKFYDLHSGYTQNVTVVKALLPPENATSGYVTQIAASDLNNNVITETVGLQIVNGEYSYTGTNTYTDSLGKTILTANVFPSYDPSSHPWSPFWFRAVGPNSGPNVGNPDTYIYNDANGNPQKVTVNYQEFTVLFPWIKNIAAPAAVYYLPANVVMPTGETFTLGYEATPNSPGSVTGRIASLGLPNGGSITYSYTGGNNGTNVLGDGSVPQLTRTVTDATGNQASWTFSTNGTETCYGSGGGGSPAQVIDPSNNTTTYTYYGAGFLQSTAVHDSANNVVASDYNVYHGLGCGNYYQPLTEIDAEHYVQQLPSPGLAFPSVIKTFYGAGGGPSTPWPTEIQRYDYSGIEVSDETLDYTSNYGTCSGYFSGPLANQPCADTVTDGNSGKIVRQVFSSYSASAHRTKVSELVSGTKKLTASYSFNSNGTLASATDVNGAVTNYSYNGPGGCNGLLLTSSSLPGGLSTSQTWDCNGGVITSSSDVNGNPTSFGYKNTAGADPLWRLLSTTDALGYASSNTYTPASSNAPATQETSLLLGTSTVDILRTLDSLGRPYLTQIQQGPGSTLFDTTTIKYDQNGRPAFYGAPCSAARSKSCSSSGATLSLDGASNLLQVGDAGGGFINFGYTPPKYISAVTETGMDVLTTIGPAPTGESASGKQVQLEYDGLGRLLSVCELSTAPGSAACPQSKSQTGFFTSYGYDAFGRRTNVTQNVGGASPQSRSYSYDDVGRLVTANDPESGLAQYFYDTAPSSPGTSCPGTYNGDLVKVYDANGNTTCYAYDALHRITSLTYSGQNAIGHNRYYVYDAATVDSATMTNVGGRMAEAYTASCPTCAKITDLGFSYSKLGQLTDVYEFTPHSTKYYHIVSTYYPNGALNTLSGVPSQNKWTFGLDGEGRPTSLTQGTTQLVTSVNYDKAGRPLKIVFGNGDSDAYLYDSNERMKSYTFTIGASQATFVGSVGWSKNGTVKTLAVVDGLNTANSQTCNYVYDDLIRLASAKCGTAWQQTFTYDAFGNINKSGSASFQAQYSPTSNRITSLPGSTVTYDANGNLTNDGVHVYTWDPENHPATVDGMQETYDALGRAVEINSTTQVVYGPFGKLATMQGQVVKRVMIPAPGGAQVEYLAGTKYIHHRDWLGTARLITNYGTRSNVYDSAFAPFGENYAGIGTPDYDFTNQTQDVVQGPQTGLYDFAYRKYSPSQGRWISPDPAGVDSVDVSHPQSWNHYAYLNNNPLSDTDPLGLDGCGGGDGGDGGDGGEASGGCDVIAWLTYNASTDTESSGFSWVGPLSADPLAGTGTGNSAIVASGPAAGLNPATGSSSSDVEISQTMVDNASALAPSLKRGASFMNFYAAATAGGTVAAVATAAAPPVATNLAARGIGWYYAAKGLYYAGNSGLMLGRYPYYIQDAEDQGANALDVSPRLYNFFESRGEFWTLNQSYLNANRLLGNGTPTLSNVPWGQGGSYFADELRWMLSHGVGPNQWQYSRRLLSMPSNPSGYPYE